MQKQHDKILKNKHPKLTNLIFMIEKKMYFCKSVKSKNNLKKRIYASLRFCRRSFINHQKQ